MLLEPLAQALAAGHVLLDTARHAAVLALRDGLGGEVVDAGAEAGVDEVTEELCGGTRSDSSSLSLIKKKNSLRARCTFGSRGGYTYADELLDLALLHALLEVALLGCAQSAESVVVVVGLVSFLSLGLLRSYRAGEAVLDK